MLTLTWLAYSIMIGVCVVAAVHDWRTGRIPNRLTYPAIVGGLLLWAVGGWITLGFESGRALGAAAVGGMLAGLIPYALLVLTAGLGGGDMKLMAAVGALSASWQVVLSTTVYALLVAVVMALGTMIHRGVFRQTLSRIVSAALLAGSRVRADLPADSPKVAFAVAVAIGAALAGAEQMLGLSTPWRALTP